MTLCGYRKKSSRSADSFCAPRDEKNGAPAKSVAFCGVEYRRFVS